MGKATIKVDDEVVVVEECRYRIMKVPIVGSTKKWTAWDPITTTTWVSMKVPTWGPMVTSNICRYDRESKLMLIIRHRNHSRNPMRETDVFGLEEKQESKMKGYFQRRCRTTIREQRRKGELGWMINIDPVEIFISSIKWMLSMMITSDEYDDVVGC